MHPINDKYCAVVVPEGAKGIDIDFLDITNQHFVMWNGMWQEQLPTGYTYSDPKLASEYTEEEAKEILPNKFDGKYFQFVKSGEMRVASMKHSFPYDTATESLHSFCRSIGATPETTLIIKREKL